MADGISFDNGQEHFSLFLTPQGQLQFRANTNLGVNESGSTRIEIADDSGRVTVGGSGEFGQLQLKSSSDRNTIFLGAGGSEASLLLGGGNSGLAGVIQLGNAQGQRTIEMQGLGGNVILGANPSGTPPNQVIGQDGDLTLRDGNGGDSIRLQGSNGNIRTISITETSDLQFKKAIVPLSHALDKILAMRGVSYYWKQEVSPKEKNGEKAQIGFIGQEMETVCPEVVSTDSNGYKSLNYSRLTVLLVEAVKDQQQLIKQQVLALGEALAKIERLENNIQIQNT